jgi:hypothetical protein
VREEKLSTNPDVIARLVADTALPMVLIGLEFAVAAVWLFARPSRMADRHLHRRAARDDAAACQVGQIPLKKPATGAAQRLLTDRRNETNPVLRGMGLTARDVR